MKVRFEVYELKLNNTTDQIKAPKFKPKPLDMHEGFGYTRIQSYVVPRLNPTSISERGYDRVRFFTAPAPGS